MTKSDQTGKIDAYKRRVSEAKQRYLLESMKYKRKMLKEREQAAQRKKGVDKL